MGEQTREGLLSDVVENGTFSEDSGEITGENTVGPSSAGHNEESIHNLSRNGDGDNSEGHIFTPHPPELPKDSRIRRPGPLKPRKLKGKRFERKVHPVVKKQSNDSSSDDDKLGHGKNEITPKFSGSKLPPLRKISLESTGDTRGFHDGPEVAIGFKNHTPLVSSLKPLAPLKDQRTLVEDFKSNQIIKEEKVHGSESTVKAPLKPLETRDVASAVTLNGQATKKELSNGTDVVVSADVSENTLTSVSSDSSSSLSDTGSETKSGQNELNVSATKFKPQPPSVPSLRSHQHHSLSLTSVRDAYEQGGGYSDTEAIHQARRAKRQSTKELWRKAKIVTYLPKVPASKARDRNSNFVQDELEKYLPEHKLMIFVGTWNMHGEKQLPVFVDDFLLPECCQFMQDLYVIGSQESTPLRKEWEIKLQEALGPSHVMIYSSAFGVLHVAMFLRRELVWFCSAVEQATVATRPGHMIKTKGAIALSLSIFGTSFLFINSHFTAHEPKWKERIADYCLIRKTLSLPLNYKESPSRNIDVTSRFQQVFWFGDFNFRVSERQGVVEKFLRQCEEDEDPSYDELLGKDQMTKLMYKEGGVFEHFKECPINFPPTYRFEINQENPGQYSSVRVPSWTDRIVYRNKEGVDIKPLYYDHCTSLINSDHRPVYGVFEASIKPITERVTFTGVHFVRDVYIEANRRRLTPPRNQNQTSVCTIL